MSNEPKLIRKRMRWEKNFTQLRNEWVRDERLSYRARGLLSLLMSYPPSHEIRVKDLVASTPHERKDAVNSAIAELEQYGYLSRTRERAKTGILLGYVWELFDPFDNGQIGLTEPVDNTRSDKPHWGTTRAADPLPSEAGQPLPIEDSLNTPRNSFRGKSRALPRAVENSWPYVEHMGDFTNRVCKALPDAVNPHYCELGHQLSTLSLREPPLEYKTRLATWEQQAVSA
ncbi:hypothetical protein [Gryllotalpicola koreensis]|uniref:Helix-turn-helix domain-containing protein n=1 Tax=Gryllotalpicola koreensis TaxID=993086 RepID=A0ABP7ZUG0_9MICO